MDDHPLHLLMDYYHHCGLDDEMDPQNSLKEDCHGHGIDICIWENG
jgi:hypothetical protein